MIKRAVSLMVGVIAVSLLIVGCGGGDDTVSQDEFAAEANAICVEAKKHLQKELENFQGNPETTTLVLLRTDMRKIGDLDTPSGKEPEVEKMLDTVQTAIGKIQSDIIKANNLFAKAEKEADKLGLTKCFVN